TLQAPDPAAWRMHRRRLLCGLSRLGRVGVDHGAELLGRRRRDRRLPRMSIALRSELDVCVDALATAAAERVPIEPLSTTYPELTVRTPTRSRRPGSSGGSRRAASSAGARPA